MVLDDNKSLEFGAKFQREVPFFWRYLNFLKTQCTIGRRKPQPDSFSRFNRTPTCDRQQTDRQTDTDTGP